MRRDVRAAALAEADETRALAATLTPRTREWFEALCSGGHQLPRGHMRHEA